MTRRPTTVVTFDQIKSHVVENGGAKRVQMRRLRDAGGYGKLGKHVARAITESLKNRGLGHLPLELPLSQNAHVTVYEIGSLPGKLVLAVTRPSKLGTDLLRAVRLPH